MIPRPGNPREGFKKPVKLFNKHCFWDVIPGDKYIFRGQMPGDNVTDEYVTECVGEAFRMFKECDYGRLILLRDEKYHFLVAKYRTKAPKRIR